MTSVVVFLLVLSAASAAVCTLITQSHITRSVRRWVASKSELLGQLIHCPFCTSFWVALVLVATTLDQAGRVTTPEWTVVDVVLCYLVIITGSAILTRHVTGDH